MGRGASEGVDEVDGGGAEVHRDDGVNETDVKSMRPADSSKKISNLELRT